MSRLARDGNADAIQVLRPSTSQTVSVSGTAAPSTAINTNVLRIVCSTDVFYSIEGTASPTSSTYLPAQTVEYIRAVEGDVVSFVTASGTGTAYITEMK